MLLGRHVHNGTLFLVWFFAKDVLVQIGKLLCPQGSHFCHVLCVSSWDKWFSQIKPSIAGLKSWERKVAVFPTDSC